MNVTVRASDLGSFDYCQEKWLAMKQGRVAFTPSPQLEAGARLHRSLDEQFLAEHPHSIDFEEFIKGEQEGNLRPQATRLRFRAQLGDIQLAGIPDELCYNQRGLNIIEDKNSLRAYDGYKNQARFYCLTLQLLYPRLATLNMYSMVRNAASMQILWEEPYTAESRNTVISEIHKLRDILMGFVKPTPCKHLPTCVPRQGDT
ncbi:MAG: hypothetical protein HZB67_00855 [Candidatus Aenigmarchaeota archaeon]|nr:hypothetical protein [Candidatus Aenigmarchaeota archaeon]MBI5224677.1 hypothetical protein [Candidatus Micrarchaeota archaeon]